MNGEISAVTFGLYAQEDITAADGSVIPADGLLEIVSVNENGQAVCSTDLPFGSFYLKELSTDSHYLLNGETFPFTFEYGGPSVAVVEISANDGEAVTNELIWAGPSLASLSPMKPSLPPKTPLPPPPQRRTAASPSLMCLTEIGY